MGAQRSGLEPEKDDDMLAFERELQEQVAAAGIGSSAMPTQDKDGSDGRSGSVFDSDMDDLVGGIMDDTADVPSKSVKKTVPPPRKEKKPESDFDSSLDD